MREMEFAADAVKKAGTLVESLRSKAMKETRKEDRDISVRADIESEKLLVRLIKKHFPRDGIEGEESGIVSEGEREWLVDPLDGTINYASGLPFYCVSLSLVQGRERLLSAVYAPSMKELFLAEREKGCTLNGKRCKVSSVSSISDSVILLTDGGGRTEKALMASRLFSAFTLRSRGVRVLGSTILGQAWVACGRAGAFATSKTSRLHASASLLAEEAGGKASGFSGEALDMRAEKQDLLVSNRAIHKEISDSLK